MRVVSDEPMTVLLVGPSGPDLAAVLRSGGFAVVEAEPGRAAAAVRARGADVVLVDLDGPDRRAALDVIEELADTVPLLAISAADAAAAVLAAVHAGAAGYLLRPVPADTLVEAVRRTAAGEAVFTPGLAAAVLDDHGGGEGPVRLTERETDVLSMVVAGYTARQIAVRLVLSPRTVENHVQHMLRKFAVPNRAALVRHAIENGLA